MGSVIPDVRLLDRLRKTFWPFGRPFGGSAEAEEGKHHKHDHDEADEIDDAVHLLSPLCRCSDRSTGTAGFGSGMRVPAAGSGPALLHCNMRGGG